jgi:PTH2 family peptidyl-tRNA hydrolase
MSPGKIASQSGHAYLGSFCQCKDQTILDEYHKDFPHSPGTKICLVVPNLAQLYRAANEAKEAGLPTFVVIDSGCPDFFGGQPIVTALGIGPARKEQIQHITKRFNLVK